MAKNLVRIDHLTQTICDLYSAKYQVFFQPIRLSNVIRSYEFWFLERNTDIYLSIRFLASENDVLTVDMDNALTSLKQLIKAKDYD